jgi:hypothetical protein
VLMTAKSTQGAGQPGAPALVGIRVGSGVYLGMAVTWKKENVED